MAAPAAPAPLATAEQRRELLGLAKWLKLAFPDDVLMPCQPGTKHPLHKHKDGQWGWPQFDKVDKLRQQDWCILLHELCVIDVDSVEQARDLEARFPVLREVPAERTKRGMHYFFARSERADVEGYFDGAAQKEQGIDFKTETSTGTGGIVVIAPSSHKVWVRPPWGADGTAERPLAIPDALLDAVALPRHPTTTALLRFTEDADGNLTDDGGELRVSGSRWLRAMAFFDALLSGRWGGDTACSESSAPAAGEGGNSTGAETAYRVPCDKHCFEQLLFFLENKELLDEPTEELVSRLEIKGDMLGVPPKYLGLLRAPAIGRVAYQRDLFDICEACWRTDRDEQVLVRAGRADLPLMHIDAELARTLLYAPLDKTANPDAWLFARLPHEQVVKAGEPVLYADPADKLRATLPAAVVDALQTHRDCLVLAGGSVVGGISPGVSAGHDFDLFVHGVDSTKADAVVDAVELATRDTHDIRRSPKAISFVPKRRADEAGRRVGGWAPKAANVELSAELKYFQVVLRLHKTPAQVIAGFDLAACKALAFFGKDARLVVEALPSCVEALRHFAFAVDLRSWGVASVARVAKYVCKGFEACVPGTRREAFKPLSAQVAGDQSLAALFAAEAAALEARDPRFFAFFRTAVERDARLTRKEAQAVARRLGAFSDYDTIRKLSGSFVYVVRALLSAASHAAAYVARQLLGRGGAAPAAAPAEPAAAAETPLPPPRVWPQAEARSSNAAFGSAEVKFRALYDWPRLAALRAQEEAERLKALELAEAAAMKEAEEAAAAEAAAEAEAAAASAAAAAAEAAAAKAKAMEGEAKRPTSPPAAGSPIKPARAGAEAAAAAAAAETTAEAEAAGALPPAAVAAAPPAPPAPVPAAAPVPAPAPAEEEPEQAPGPAPRLPPADE